jgi:hypothetical protein
MAVFELDDAGIYQPVAEVKGDDPFEAKRPFPVTVVLSALGRKRRR